MVLGNCRLYNLYGYSKKNIVTFSNVAVTSKNIDDALIVFSELLGDNIQTLMDLKNLNKSANQKLYLVIDDTYEGLLTQSLVDEISNWNYTDVAFFSSNEKIVGKNVHFVSSHLLLEKYDGIDVPKLEWSPNLLTRSKKFLCLNRHPRLHRIKTVNLLRECGALENSFVSCAKQSYQQRRSSNTLSFDELCKITDPNKFLNQIQNQIQQPFEDPYLSQYDYKEYDMIQNILPLELDLPEKAFYGLYAKKDVPELKQCFNESYWSIITERNFFETDLYKGWTEKVLKCFAYGHPFVVVGLPHTLKTLKELGFITFAQFIDESYDNEFDNSKRFAMIKQQIQYLNSLNLNQLDVMYKSFLPILKYNFDHYKNLNKNNHISSLTNQVLQWLNVQV